MSAMKESSNGKKKKPFSGVAVFFIVMIVASLLEDMPRGSYYRYSRLFPLLAVLLLVVLFVVIIAKAAKKSAEQRGFTAPPARQSVHPPQHRAPAQPHRADPDAYCLVCDQTGVDHFERDRQRRLRQIDYWLSIGLIERKEYNQLRARYSRDVPHQKLK